VPKRAPRASTQPLKVLIVDDHVLMLRSLVRLLEGLQTVVASSARQALLLLHSGVKFDAVVSDVMMPIMSGPDLYVRCYRESPELGRRFVFASADPIAAGELLDRAAALVGAERAPVLLAKPTSRELLLAAIFSVATPHESGTYEIGLPNGIATLDADSALGRGDSGPSKGSRGAR
jgi:CheY-like chemotaxis protein